MCSPQPTDKAPGAQKRNSLPKVIQVSEGVTANLQAASGFPEIAPQGFLSLCVVGFFCLFFFFGGGGGCLFSSLLPPSSVSTGLGISETSHNKLCSVRKGADAKKQMLQSKMVFLGSQSLLQGY